VYGHFFVTIDTHFRDNYYLQRNIVYRERSIILLILKYIQTKYGKSTFF